MQQTWAQTFDVKRGVDVGGSLCVLAQTRVAPCVLRAHARYLQRTVGVHAEPRVLHGLRGGLASAPGKEPDRNVKPVRVQVAGGRLQLIPRPQLN